MATKPDKTRRELSVEQRNAIDLLVLGKTDREVADAVGASRQTVNAWRNHHPEFAAELNLRREEVWGAGVDRLRSLLPKALGVLERALEADPPDPKTAIEVLKLGGLASLDLGTYGVGTTNPERYRRREAARRREDEFADLLAAGRF